MFLELNISFLVVNLGFYCFTGFSQNSKKQLREITGKKKSSSIYVYNVNNVYNVKEPQRKF